MMGVGSGMRFGRLIDEYPRRISITTKPIARERPMNRSITVAMVCILLVGCSTLLKSNDMEMTKEDAIDIALVAASDHGLDGWIVDHAQPMNGKWAIGLIPKDRPLVRGRHYLILVNVDGSVTLIPGE